jgi:hypothetical protein
MKMNDYKGRFVRLTRRIENKGGDVFLPGEVMVVTGHYRGKLELNRPARTSTYMPDNAGHHVSQVEKYSVELLPENPREILKVILEGAEALAKSCDGVLAYEIEVDGKKVVDRFRPEKVSIFRSVGNGSIERDEKGLPKALVLG